MAGSAAARVCTPLPYLATLGTHTRDLRLLALEANLPAAISVRWHCVRLKVVCGTSSSVLAQKQAEEK